MITVNEAGGMRDDVAKAYFKYLSVH